MSEESYVTRTFISFSSPNIVTPIKSTGTTGTHGRNEKCIHGFGRKNIKEETA